jgi:transposase
VKILVWDGSGLVLIWKRLEGGAFRWPAVVDGVLRLSAVAFAALFDGIDWRRIHALREIPKQICRQQRREPGPVYQGSARQTAGTTLPG